MCLESLWKHSSLSTVQGAQHHQHQYHGRYGDEDKVIEDYQDYDHDQDENENEEHDQNEEGIFDEDVEEW